MELSRSVNDFTEAPDDSLHLLRLTDITGRGASDAVLLNRQELTRSLEETLGDEPSQGPPTNEEEEVKP